MSGEPQTHGATKLPWLGPGVLLGSLVPLAALLLSAARGTLGADPVAIALNRLGLLALILLLACLTATPARIVFGVTWPLRLRRMLGLLSFGYASLHLLLYVVIDQRLALGAILDDVLERRFITVGFAAWLLLVPLALTSTAKLRKRLGGKRWQRLHRLVYLIAVLGCIHFTWRVKKDLSQPVSYALVLAGLLAVRLAAAQQRRARRAAMPAR